MPTSTHKTNLPLDNKVLLARLGQCTDLPSPVGVAVRILELGQDPEVSLGDVAKVISLDPALTAKLLRMANSPLYARHRKTENLRQAITLFGVEGTITLALSFSVVNRVKDKGDRRLDYDHFWRRSLAAATCAQVIGERVQVHNKEDLFLCGLLQDIGMLALDRSMPELYQQCDMRAGHARVIDHENTVLGLDHAEVGAWLLQRWNFPEKLQIVIAASHEPAAALTESTSVRQQIDVVALASEIADLLSGCGSKDSISGVMQKAQDTLGLQHETFVDVLAASSEVLKDIAHLFEIRIDDQVYLDSLINEACDLILLRQINVMQRSTTLARTAEVLEDRTRKLEEENRRDPLTGLYNRAYLNQVLAEEIRMASRHNWPFTVMFIDLDDFKRVNDEHGHLVGDVILKNTARILMENTRGSDIVARYGGEEFIVVLPGAGHDGAEMTGNRLLAAFRGTHHLIEGRDIVVTASIGAATHGEKHEFTSLEDVLKAADQALYSAKRSGRNQAFFFSQDPA
ncbi:MAG: GGDEF domain-containing protein [Gammaproteobacteria bacterium]|nr:GGDEF domain-containing protein [Gammaproteobacteria bacterium]